MKATPPEPMKLQPSALDDAELLSRSVAGDRRAREELARACIPRVRRMVFLTTGATSASGLQRQLFISSPT